MRPATHELRLLRLTTAEILYRMPDHPSVLQSYIWQEFDLVPELPALHRFLTFWECHIDGRLHEVRVASASDPDAQLRFRHPLTFTLH